MDEGEAPGVGEVLGAAGPCPEVEWKGRRWKVGHPVQRAKAELESLVTARASAEVSALKSAVPPQEYAAYRADFLRMVGAGEYRTWGRGWVAAVEGPDGHLLFLWSLLRCHQPDVTEADVLGLLGERGDEVAVALAEVVPGFLAALAAGLKVPPAARGELARRMAADFSARAPVTPTAVTS